MEFCKQFNARTQDKAGKILPVIITYYADNRAGRIPVPGPGRYAGGSRREQPKSTGNPLSDAVARLLHVETPCVVGRGVFEENVALPETVRPGRAAEPQKGFVLFFGACRRLCDNLFVNV